MSKSDVIFKKLIGEERFAKAYNVNPHKYANLEAGLRAYDNVHVQAIATIVHDMNRLISAAASDMNIRKQAGPVSLDESEYRTLYRKIIHLLTK
ncbi:MAG: hypothetical protein LKF48_10130 [Prevotella sp.]|jgi:hypothetical protein|nr:hypothetical protein [Prevotella sp.]MCH4183499.1 hypothetical protein [Prevotella sp.]MCH4213144.1 hypothetical protein [Prevotella sp.]